MRKRDVREDAITPNIDRPVAWQRLGTNSLFTLRGDTVSPKIKHIHC